MKKHHCLCYRIYPFFYCPDIYDRTFTCKGKVQIGEGYVICNGTHGKVNFEKALNKLIDIDSTSIDTIKNEFNEKASPQHS